MQNTEDNKPQRKIFKDYEIFSGKIRLIRDDRSQIVIDRDKAIDIAKSNGKNLVQIAYNKNDFPHSVCKIIDYSKHLYEQKKREKKAKKQARANEAEIKEINFTIRIDDGDFNTKCKHIIDFLENGAKVKVNVKLSRRESNLQDLAKDMMKRILSKLDSFAELDQAVVFSELTLTCLLKKKKK